jgi:hypothetical protein
MRLGSDSPERCSAARPDDRPRTQRIIVEARRRADLASLQETSLDAALNQLRPEWLRVSPSSRQVAEPTHASVYIDNVYTGDIESLRLVPVSAVIEVSFLGSSAARDRFGLGCRCAAGAIVVVTRNTK